MFTGIIEEAGIIRSLRPGSAGATMLIEAQRIAPGLKSGDSVAVNGVCLTVVITRGGSFSCDLSAETLRRSSLEQAREGQLVNLERPLAVGDRLGGHIVQGHVDGVGRFITSVPSGEGMEMEFSFPPELERYLVNKGSVAVDGISLTVASLKKTAFVVAVIPHTFRVTNLRHLKPGDMVNLEVDILAKYFERFFQLGMTRDQVPKQELTVDFLREQGY
ncbi:MAG: riboflavin synthase [Acidobacteriia bacterium]|nr:riboflavin synthase [Terriglobia bacterium]